MITCAKCGAKLQPTPTGEQCMTPGCGAGRRVHRKGGLAIDAIRKHLEAMTPDERLDVFNQITEGYCKHCGGPAGCQCWNDE